MDSCQPGWHFGLSRLRVWLLSRRLFGNRPKSMVSFVALFEELMKSRAEFKVKQLRFVAVCSFIRIVGEIFQDLACNVCKGIFEILNDPYNG